MKKLLLLLLLFPFLVGAMPSNMNDREFSKFQETNLGLTSVRVKISPDSTIAGTLITTTTIPSGPYDTCTAGAIAIDSTYLYACTSANTWQRTTWTAWSVTRTPLMLNGIQLQLNGVNLQK